MTHHVILGAGPAGVIAAETIRKHAPADTITLVGDEPEQPYSRMAIPYLLIGDIEEPPIEADSVDLAFLSQALHHAEHPQKALDAAGLIAAASRQHYRAMVWNDPDFFEYFR